MRTAGVSEVLQGRYSKRMSLYRQFEEQIQKLKGYKDPSAYQAVTRNILADLKLCIIEVPTGMKLDNASLVDKVLELQKQEKVYRDLLTNHGHLVERLVCGKMNKQQFLDAEINISKKKEQLAEKLNQLVASI